jgi:Carboxypeptidase regulatory-like domain
MKRIIATSLCVSLSVMCMAQNAKPVKPAPHKVPRPLVTGTIRDARNHPMPGVETFIYQKDSSIIASGFTDSMGHYETNAVMPGTYTVKVMYRNAKAMNVPGVVIKGGPTLLDVKANAPEADTMIPYTTLMPPPEKKAPAKKK